MRWIPTVLFFAFVCAIVYLADGGYAREWFAWIQNSSGGDKVGHFVLIGGLAYFLNTSLRCRRWRGMLAGSAVVVLLCSLEEISQAWCAHRHFDLRDLAADYGGIFVAGMVAQRVGRSAPQE